MNKENEIIIDDKKIAIDKSSSDETLRKVLQHFGIYAAASVERPSAAVVPAEGDRPSFAVTVEVWGT